MHFDDVARARMLDGIRERFPYSEDELFEFLIAEFVIAGKGQYLMTHAAAESCAGWYAYAQAAPGRTLPINSQAIRSHVPYRERFYLSVVVLNPSMRSAKPAKPAFVYILRCRDGSFYTGWTDDLERRLRSHAAGKASRYTRSRLPVRLTAWFALEDAPSARSLEARFKRLTRQQKIAAMAQRQAFGVAMHKARGL